MSSQLYTEALIYNLIWALMDKGLLTNTDYESILEGVVTDLLKDANNQDYPVSVRKNYLEAADLPQKILASLRQKKS